MARNVKTKSFLGSLQREIGIDMGTSNTRIYVKGSGVVLDEPSVIAMDKSTNEIVAVGKRAKEMTGKAGDSILLLYPIKKGVVADFEVCEAMLRGFIKAGANTGILSKPRIIMSVPSNATEVEKNAAEDVAKQVGGTDISLIEAPLAACVGAGFSPASPKGFMVINLGAAISEVAVVALGDVISSETIYTAGNAIDEAVMQYIAKVHRLSVGALSAEQIKKDAGCMPIEGDEFYSTLEIKGRSIVDNLPKSIILQTEEIREVIRACLNYVIKSVIKVCEKLPPELSADVLDQGIILSGNTANMKGIKAYFENELGLMVNLSSKIGQSVVYGVGTSLDSVLIGRQARMRK